MRNTDCYTEIELAIQVEKAIWLRETLLEIKASALKYGDPLTAVRAGVIATQIERSLQNRERTIARRAGQRIIGKPKGKTLEQFNAEIAVIVASRDVGY